MAKRKSRIGFDPLAWMKDCPESRVASREPLAVGLGQARDPGGSCDARQWAYDSIRLGDSLTIAQIRRVHGELKQLFAATGGSVLTLDGSAVEAVDTAGVQLLVAFLREAGARGITVRWRSASPALRDCASRLGLREALQLS